MMTMNENIAKGKTIDFTGQFKLRPQYRAEQLGKATIPNTMSEDVDLSGVGKTWSQLHYSGTGAVSRYRGAR